MRLTTSEIIAIKSTVKTVYKGGRVWLFGSRVDDRGRGGDIDLFVETLNKTTLKDKLRFLVQLEKKGIFRKVDVIVKNPDSEYRSIFETARKTGVLL